MNTIFKKSLLSLSVAAAIGAAGTAQAAVDSSYTSGVVIFDRSGSGGNLGDVGVIEVAKFDWTPSTMLIQDAFNTLIDAADTNSNGVINFSSEATFSHSLKDDFTVWTHGRLGTFNGPASSNDPVVPACASPPDCAPIAGTEFTFQFGLQMDWTGSPGTDANGQITSGTASESPEDADSDGIVDGAHFVLIWYDASPDVDQLAGTGFGDDDLSAGIATTNSCDVAALNAAADDGSILIMCGMVFYGELSVSRTAASTARLDGNGTDNYTSLGTQRLGGALAWQVDVLYQNDAFFRNDITQFAANILDSDPDLADGDGQSQNVSPFTGVDPSANVVGQSWTTDLGIDRLLIGSVGTRTMDNYICANSNSGNIPVSLFSESIDCSAVQMSDASMTFRVTDLPEPGALFLFGAGLGLIGLTSRRIRRMV